MNRQLRQAVALLLCFALVPMPSIAWSAGGNDDSSDSLAQLDKISVSQDQVDVHLTQPAKYNTFTTANPPRIVLEVLGVGMSLTTRVYAGRGANLKRVRAGQFQGEPNPIARVVMDLKQMAKYTVTPDGNSLVVKIEGAPASEGAPVASAPASATPASTAPAGTSPTAAAPAPAAAQVAKTPAAAAPQPAPAPSSSAGAPTRLQERPVADKELGGMNAGNSTLAPPAAPPATPTATADSYGMTFTSEPPPRDILGSLSHEKVSLDFQETDIGDALKLLGAKANINVVYGPDVFGTLTLHLNDVPFNEAFSIVLGMKSLMMFQVGENTVRIITAKQLQKERQDTVGLTRVIPVGFSDANDIKRQVDLVRTQEKRVGQTVVDTKDNAIIVTDTPEGIASAERLIRELDARPKQVLIETKLVEVNLSKDMELGIQWDYFSAEQARINGQQGLNLIGGNPTQTPPSNIPLDLNTTQVPSPYPIGAAGRGTGVALAADKSFGAFTFGRVTSNYLLSATLTAAAAKGKVKILSDPKVTTLNNKAATVNITTNLPYATTNTSATGAQTTTINSTIVGVTLTVTPTVNADGRISLHVTPNISKPSAQLASGGAATAGAISTDSRQVDTNVMVRDGETIVIGGLITDSLTDTEAGIPFFQDIPLIGWLFKKKTQIRQRVELLIFVTTKILQD